MSAPNGGGADQARDVVGPEQGAAAAAPRPEGTLQWPGVVALTSFVVFAGLVAAGVFDPMLGAL